jgi:cytochrome c oxidase subunit 2
MKRILAMLAAVSGLAACAGVQTPLAPAGDEAHRLFGLWSLMLWVCGAAYLAVLVLLAWALWRNRDVLHPGERNERGLKVGLVAWAGFVTLGLSVLAGASFLVDRALSARASDPLEVRVTGQQWWWRVQYRDPATGGWVETANEVHLPLGRPAHITVASTDVIHSFWIPNLSGKIDMIPGRINAIPVTPRRTGWFRGQCAEFCGLQHAQMALDVKVEPPEIFAAWLARQAGAAPPPADPLAGRGLQVISTGTCGQCHSVRGTPAAGRAGPDLTHVASRRSLAAGTLPFTRASLMGWIAQPQALKPGAEMPASGLSPADALAVTAYLERLK